MQVDEPDELDQPEVHIHQFLSLLYGFGLEQVALTVDPDIGECLLGCIKYLGYVSEVALGVEYPVCLSVVVPILPGLGGDLENLR